MRRTAAVLATVLAASSAAARPPVVTFDKNDAARAYSAGCGTGIAGTFSVRRNPGGGMLSIVASKQSEAVVQAAESRCIKLSAEVLDVWRDEKGRAAAQLIERSDAPRLLIGQDTEIRGKRFDIDRTGQYLMVSQGPTSTLSAVARPYIKLATLEGFDAQRVFLRKGTLLLVGDNAAANRLEARIARVQGESVTIDPQAIAIGDTPAGAKVHDYAEDSDELLVGGQDAAGAAAFNVVGLMTGKGQSVKPSKPSDTLALFVADAEVRMKLTGTKTPAAPGSGGGGGGLRMPFFGKRE